MTIKQVQLLLLYLGYDPGEADGVAGAKTRAAVKAFQASEGLAQDGVAGELTKAQLMDAVANGRMAEMDEPTKQEAGGGTTGTFWDRIKYFKPEEPNIRCPCPRCVGKQEDPTEALMKMADSIREELGPMVPSSVRRCQAHNDELSGSAKNSRHIIGKAMDFNCPKSTPAQIESCLTRRKKAGEIRYWYRMSSGWYHFDID